MPSAADEPQPAGLPAADGAIEAALPPHAPPKADPHARTGLLSFRIYWWLTLLVIVVDQVTKVLIRTSFTMYESVHLIPDFLDLTRVENSGVAFGLMNNAALPYKAALTAAMAGLALLGIGLYARHIRREEYLARVGLSLILGGAIGNLIDRLWAGSVIDFVDLYWNGWHFWAFNVADASITIGAVLVFLDLLLVTRHASDSV